ncbi:hypothetical protein [Herbidospora mongoliensis]|uniref:hypothetical protein n=1 Tax=Herbidospora mongoliensis TaxID=688067 RepID=UPI00082FE2CA|nr:hypothetical protein [Herbidospora mongoliensis]
MSHVHVDRKVLQAGAAYRNLLVSSTGLVPDEPTVVTTGCGIQVPYALTSVRPESVTCLACREHAAREHLAYADQVRRLGRMTGSVISADEADQAADRARDIARKFAN